MFRHHGDTRTHEHNLKIASLLSFVAGSVNVVGFLSIQRLTTNVTGHFAFFMDDVLKLKFYDAAIFFLYILFFFLGAFASNTLIEFALKRNEKYLFVLPLSTEISILAVMALGGNLWQQTNPTAIALSLLFAMGLQNAMVTRISNAVVRTTHLTGLFTDLGIEVSQLLFYKTTDQHKKLRANISLRLTIITFFFIGGVLGGVLYTKIGFYFLLIPSFLLLTGLTYDFMRFRLLKLKRKIYAANRSAS